jgi:RNA polymerase sigma factor (sigma-70 family)
MVKGSAMRQDPSDNQEGTADLLPRDRQVLDGFRSGASWALSRVFRAYMPLVRTIVCHGFSGFRGFGNPADQDDMVQTVFAEAFEERCRLRYDGITPYSAFLRGLAHNKVRQRLSQDHRFSRTDGAPEPFHPSAENPEERLLSEEQRQVLSRFRAQLDTADGRVLEMYFVQGLAEETIAAELQCTRYRVRKQVAALHKRMVKLMRECDVLP